MQSYLVLSVSGSDTKYIVQTIEVILSLWYKHSWKSSIQSKVGAYPLQDAKVVINRSASEYDIKSDPCLVYLFRKTLASRPTVKRCHQTLAYQSMRVTHWQKAKNHFNSWNHCERVTHPLWTYGCSPLCSCGFIIPFLFNLYQDLLQCV